MTDSYTTNLEISESISEPMFYIVSPKKFAILFVTTLGLYSVYWFYKNWSLYRNQTKEKIWPIPRSIFSIFFVHSLFRHIHEKIVTAQKSIQFEPKSSATLLVILMLISNVLDRAAGKSLGSPDTDILSLIMLIPLVIQFLKAQAAINLACDDADGSSNSVLTTANYIWIAIGCLLWAAYISGLVAGNAS